MQHLVYEIHNNGYLKVNITYIRVFEYIRLYTYRCKEKKERERKREREMCMSMAMCL